MTDKDETYEGWTNQETWAVNLELSNDEGLYLTTTEMAKQALMLSSDLFDYDKADAIAAQLGFQAGCFAARSCLEAANTLGDVQREYEDGTLEISSPLSGEWADDWTPNKLARAVGLKPFTLDYDESIDALCQTFTDQYDTGFDQAFTGNASKLKENEEA